MYEVYYNQWTKSSLSVSWGRKESAVSFFTKSGPLENEVDIKSGSYTLQRMKYKIQSVPGKVSQKTF